MSRTWSFRGSWVVPAPVEQVHAVLIDLEHYSAWWPQVRAVASLGPDDALVLCRSVLPYTLELHLHAVHREPRLLETSIDGDLVGSVRWRLTPDGGGTRLGFEQDVEVVGRLLTFGSYVGRPLLGWNHHRMMAGCVDGLKRRLSDCRP